jgi:hypothetical protein
MSDWATKLEGSIYAAVTYILIGWVAAGYFRPVPPVPGPVPPPAPVAIRPAKHTGHLYVSYIEPRYGTPTSAAVRDALAGTDWSKLDATFRSYTDGQDELTTLGFDKHFEAADLPEVFIQESGPKGAPIIATVNGPASASIVLARIKELRGP